MTLKKYFGMFLVDQKWPKTVWHMYVDASLAKVCKYDECNTG